MTFIAVGGAEDKQGDMTVWKRILDEAKGITSRVCVITTATDNPACTRQKYEEAFHQLGFKNFVIHHIGSREQANDPFMAAEMAEADVVFMSGGNQLKLTTLLAATATMKTITERYKDGSLVVAGTSAGAAAASSLMIYRGRAHEQGLEKDEVMMTAGLGFIDGAVIDTHFSQRGRLSRLFNAVSTNPGILGIGLDEDTGIVFKDGHFEVIGSGTVSVVDGLSITSSNICDIEPGQPIVTMGIITHRLSAAEGFDTTTRQKTFSPA